MPPPATNLREALKKLDRRRTGQAAEAQRSKFVKDLPKTPQPQSHAPHHPRRVSRPRPRRYVVAGKPQAVEEIRQAQ